MQKIVFIALKDFVSTYRNKVMIAMMLVAPLVLASLLGLAFGRGDSSYSISAVKVVFVDQDEGLDVPGQGRVALGSILAGILESTELEDILSVTRLTDESAARQWVDQGKATCAVIVPRDLTKALLERGEPAKAAVVVYQNPAETLGPAIVNSLVQEALDIFNGARAAMAAVMALTATPPADLSETMAKTVTSYFQTAMQQEGSALKARGPQLGPKSSRDPGVAGMVLSGMMVFFMFIGAANVARTILDEDYQGTLRRLFTTPTSRSAILAGKMTAVFVTVLVQAIILLLAGWALFRINWGAVAPVALLTVVGALVSAGLGVMLISFATTPGQAGALSSSVLVVLALLGGNFVGGVMPSGFFATVRRFTPNGWLLEAWDKTLRGGGLEEIWVQLGVVLGFVLLTFVVGSVVFRRRYA